MKNNNRYNFLNDLRSYKRIKSVSEIDYFSNT